MRAAKYRISELANGRFRVEVNAANDPGQAEHWVHTSKDEYLTQIEAAIAITRLVQNRNWLYDENGASIEQ